MKNTIYLAGFAILFSFISFFPVSPENATLNPEIEIDSNLQFTENKGQWEEFIRYKANLNAGYLFLEDNRFTFLLLNAGDLDQISDCHHKNGCEMSDQSIRCHSYHINFLNSSAQKEISADKKLSHYKNYFLGNDPSKWASEVNVFKMINYKELYGGIDLRLYGSGSDIKYDFIVHPQADISKISLEYEGVDKIFIKNNKLHIITSVNEITEQEPYAYQIINDKKIKVPCNYVLEKNVVKYSFPEGYDKSYELIIDPTLVFSSFTGSFADNWGFTATFDDSGNLYAGGIAFDFGYPTTTGAFQESFAGGAYDVSISKFSPTGDQLIYSTYIGGNSKEHPQSMIVNSLGQLIILGLTSSPNFPVTAISYDNTFNGDFDIFVIILNSSGSGVINSTYIGGTSPDGYNLVTNNYGDQSRSEVIIDDLDNILFVSSTTSTDFPTTSGVISPTISGEQDACIVKMSSDLQTMIWSTLFGGSGYDGAFSLRMDNDGNIFFVGATESGNLPTTSGALQENFQGQTDAFVTKINADATEILACTYLGTENKDFGFLMDINNDNEIYITGQSVGGQYPVTAGVYSNPNSGQFIHKLNNDLNTTIFSTVFGNSSGLYELSPTAFMIDVCGRIYFSGWGGLLNISGVTIEDMPLTSDAFQSTTDGNDFYFIVFNSEITDIEYATYFGGTESDEHVDGGTSRFDKKGIIYQAVCGGCGGNNDFPTTPGAYSQTNNSSNCNLAVVKFNFEQPLLISEAHALPTTTGCAPLEINFINQSIGAEEYFWDFDDGTTSTEITPTHIFNQTGEYSVKLIAYGTETCISSDTTTIVIKVIENQQSNITDLVFCEGDSIQLTPISNIPSANYEWQDGSAGNSFSATNPGTFWVKTSLANCFAVDTFHLNVISTNGFFHDTIYTCDNNNVILSSPLSASNASYHWNNNSNSQQISTHTDGLFWVITSLENCSQTDSFYVSNQNIIIDEEIQFPNVFTPNNDNINDVFKPVIEDGLEILTYDLKIFNRWGQIIFESTDKDKGWNGKYNNKNSPSDINVFLCIITYTQCNITAEKIFRGDVSLVR